MLGIKAFLFGLLASSGVVARPPTLDASLRTIYEFPNETWVENLAVRENGKILVSLINTPEVWQVDPTSGTAELVHHFPDATSATGIAEVCPDLFVVAIGNWSIKSFQSTPDSWSIWTIDFQGPKPKIHKVTDLPYASFINGMTPLTIPNVVLVGDPGLGIIHRVNVENGKHSIAISDEPALRPNISEGSALGVNGIHVQDGYLYWVNSFKRPFFGRIPITSSGSAAGAVQVIASEATYPRNLGAYGDDFALDKHGNAWIATDPSDEIVKISIADGKQRVVVGGLTSTLVAGSTSAAFGRTKSAMDILYITTNGGILFPPPGGIVGGKVLMMDTSGL